MNQDWDIPVFETHEFYPKKTKYCFLVVTLNEGDRIIDQLRRMKPKSHEADIIIADGRSTDGSMDHDFLKQHNVRSLLITDEKGLSTATRMGFAYAIDQGYEGIITVDGNGKDGIESITEYIKTLDEGYDFIQGSRFIKGGFHKNTPLKRYLGCRFIMSPFLFLGSRFYYTDPTNAFKGIKTKFLLDPRVKPFRKEFVLFNLQLYINYQAARLGYKVKELPVSRVYPDDGSVPTKITSLKLELINTWEMILVAIGFYNPKVKSMNNDQD